jgi:lipoprotein-releasing system permease protein
LSSKFISKKLIKELQSSNKFSKPIIKVSIISIAISILVMLISISIVKGFQKEIKDKVVNFSSHFQITQGGTNFSFESSPIHINQPYYPFIDTIDGIKHIQTFATKPGIIQSKADTQFLDNDNIKIIRDIEGIIFKGINNDFNWEFLNSKLIEGKPFVINKHRTSDSILISKHISKKLKLNVNDKIKCYFIKGKGPAPKKFVISGIYETGLEEFDKQFAFIDIKHTQKLNGWGVEASLFLEDNCDDGKLFIRAIGSGGNGNFRYNWGDGYEQNKIKYLCINKDTTIRVIITDFETNRTTFISQPVSIPDTAYLKISITNNNQTGCKCNNNEEIEYESINDSTRKYSTNSFQITTITSGTGGSMKYYVGGFEIFVDDFNKINDIEKILYRKVEPVHKITKITDLYQEIFGWLNILDTNVVIIIILMIMVAIINIISLLLVLIIERTNMIGLLKSFGATNYTIQKIFISIGSYILFRGLLFGNAIAILLIFLQKQFGFLKLPQENYYLSEVPMGFEISHFITINILTVIFCFLILLLTSLFVTRISPIKAIKFN